MVILTICALAALGLLTASNAIMEKLPSAERLISFIRPFEEIIGIGSFCIGLFKLVFWVLGLAILFDSPVKSLFSLAISLVLIGLGSYLARATLSRTLPFASGYIEMIVEKVTPRRETLGIAALVLAAISLFFWTA